MLFKSPAKPHDRWRVGFALFPRFLGTENGKSVWTWLTRYEYRKSQIHPHDGGEHPYWEFVEYRKMGAGPDFETYVFVPSYQ